MKNRLFTAGITLLFCTLTGVMVTSLPGRAEIASTLIAQQSELAEADRLFQAGLDLYTEGSAESLQQALDFWAQAVPLYESIGALEKQAFTWVSIGSTYNLLGEPETALTYFNQALPLWRNISNPIGEAVTLNNMGSVYDALGEAETALDYYNQALPLIRDIGDQAGEATTLSNIGAVYNSLGDTETALDYYNQALPLMRDVGDQAGEASTLNNMGAVYSSVGDKKTALDYFNQALPLMRAVGNRADEANTLSNIGNVYDDLGETETALDYYNQALPLRRAVGDRAGEAITLNNLGRVYDDLGEKETALDYYNQALPLSRTVGDRANEATTLTNIGLVYDDLGEKETALGYYNQALPLMRDIGNRAGEATTLNNIGRVYDDLGQTETALDYHNQALPLRRDVGDRAGEATTLNNIASAYDNLGQTETALDYYNQALPLMRDVGNRAGEADTFGNIAVLYLDQDAPSEALSSINAAIALIEDLRSDISPGELRASYFATVQGYYHLKQNLLMQLGQPAEAFETSEAARSRLLIELLSESNVNIRQGVDSALLEQEQSLQQELTQLEQQRIALRSGNHTPEQAATLDSKSDAVLQQLDQVIAQIRRSSPAYADIVEPQPLSLPQIQQQVLDTDTVLLQYALGKEQSYLWIVGQNQFQTYTLPGEADIQAAATQFQSTVTTQGNSPSDVKRKGDELRALVLPDQPDWMQGKRLLIAGDGILSELPFAALPLPNKETYTPLLVEHEVLTQPSITAISVLRQQLASRGDLPPSVAVLADPVYRADDARLQSAQNNSNNTPALPSATERNLRDLDLRAIERLPYTRQESDNILQLAEQNNLATIKALDFDADADWVRSPELKNYTMVHLATHGFINPVNPQLSGIVLSLVDEGGQLKDNGFLRLHDIFNLNLAAELVVLSACQTGQGENISGEGIVGLSRGFMYAGAERVAVSLWNVNDAATAELMSEFYQYILEDELTPAAAMRRAQLDAWEAGQNPYLWAAFTLQGEWQP